ncbi:MAG: sulfatase family protein [Planctomycetota bacterium]|jgi:arylsulfatase A-like enzyme
MAQDFSRPNVVLFMVDQLSARWLEAARAGACAVPNIERLAAMGVTFTNTFTPNPVCMPARATIATGLTARGHGVLENGYELSPELPTFMHALQQAGYRTGALGKLHFRSHYRDSHLNENYRAYGFDVVHNTEDSRGGEWLDWVAAEHPEHVDNVLATVWAGHIPWYSQYGPEKADLASRIRRVREGFEYATAKCPDATQNWYPLPFPAELSQTEWTTRHALDFIRETPADQPLFAQISYVQPHGPFHPPEEYLDRVDESKIPEIAPAEWHDNPDAPNYYQQYSKPNYMEGSRKYYFADIAHLDEQLGRVLDGLEESGRADNTLVIFTADHGEMLGDHGLQGKEEHHYDACIHIPLMIAGPGLQAGTVHSEMVQLEDICPTILDATGQSLPLMPTMGPDFGDKADVVPILPGRSLLPLCRGQDVTDWRAAAYAESYNPVWSTDRSDWARTIRTHQYRYTLYACNNGEQLFDMQADPQEQNNLAGAPAFAGVRQELRDQLMELIIMQDYPKTRRSLFAIGVH